MVDEERIENELRKFLNSIERIPAEWLNDVGRNVIRAISRVLSILREKRVTLEVIQQLIINEEYSLDVFRLILGVSQDEFLNELRLAGINFRNWKDLRNFKFRTKKSYDLARVLCENLGLIEIIKLDFEKSWTYDDVLIERYKYSRGRAVKAQLRGGILEDEVKAILDELKLKYDRERFRSRSGKIAKCDFSIPSSHEPMVIIEVKVYEATGSKQTDVLGDILKILEAKDPETKFYVVTDGIGWFRRLSDLKQIIKYYLEGSIHGVYTRSMLPMLEAELKNLFYSNKA